MMMEMEETEFSDRIHPLLVPGIVDIIMEHLPEQLRESRLVCKQWADSGSKVLRKRYHLRVNNYTSTTIEKFSELVNITRNCQFLSFANFNIHSNFFQENNLQVFADFLLTYSPVLESLKISMDRKCTMNFDQNSFFLLWPIFKDIKFPRLTKFSLEDERYPVFCQTSFQDTSPRLLNWIIQASPNLDNLNVKYQRETSLNGVERSGVINEIMNRIIQEDWTRRAFKRLKSLKLAMYFDDELINTIAAGFAGPNTPKLETLKISLSGSQISSESMFGLLSSLKSRLVTFLIDYLAEESNVTFKFPKMPVLEVLKIDGCGYSFKNVNFETISIAQQFPKLKSLLFGNWANKEDWNQFLQSKNPILTLQELKLPEEIISFDKMIGISATFPDLTKLEFKLPQDWLEIVRAFEVIFKSLTKLQDMKVNERWNGYPDVEHDSNKMLDFVMTGLPQRVCENMVHGGHLQSAECERKAFIRSKMEKHAQNGYMGIANLKQLRKLEIRNIQDIGGITDVTGYFGFLQMENLEILDVGRSYMNMECVKRLAEKCPMKMERQVRLPSILCFDYNH